jgi:lysozyme family protein
MTNDALIDLVMVREGWPTFSNDPADRGGPTKGGITQADLERLLGRPVTAEEVETLDASVARAIYASEYIEQWHFDLIADDWVQDFVVDMAVLQGQENAVHVLQGVLGVPMDGEIGPVTLASLSLALRQPNRLRKALIRERMHRLLDAMCVGVPKEMRQTTNLKWRHGWTNRVLDFLPD